MSDDNVSVERIKLNDAERLSAAWHQVERHAKHRLSTLRAQLEGDLDELKTAKIRGSIAELKAILQLAEEDPQI